MPLRATRTGTATAMRSPLRSVLATIVLLAGCGGGGIDTVSPAAPGGTSAGSGAGGRGVVTGAPWVSFYGSAQLMGDLSRVASTFRLINIDADPDQGNFTPAQIATLRAGGTNQVISYLNLGACERTRSYWSSAPAGFVSCGSNVTAQLGAYTGYPDETWMNVGDAEYQHLILDYVAPRLVAQGVDGFFFDNVEIVEHAPGTGMLPTCDAACAQGGLDLIRKLREKYPPLIFVMQNATGPVTRLGTTGGIAFPSLLDGISHEEVYVPYDASSESELRAWQALGLHPGGHPFWIGTEDYVGSCANTATAHGAYDRSRVQGFSPYATDESAGQQVVCYWGF